MVRTSNNEGLGTWNSNPNRSYMMGRVCSNHTTWQTTMTRFGVQPEASDFRSTRSSAEVQRTADFTVRSRRITSLIFLQYPHIRLTFLFLLNSTPRMVIFPRIVEFYFFLHLVQILSSNLSGHVSLS